MKHLNGIISNTRNSQKIILVWFFYIGLLITTHSNPKPFFVSFLLYYLSISVCFFVHAFIFHRITFEERKLKLSIFTLVLALLIYYFLNYLRYGLRPFYAPNDPLPFEISKFLVLFINDYVIHSVYGNVYGYYLSLKKQEEIKIQLDKKNKEVQLDFLKTQINQHFLYNTINLLYVKTNKYSNKLADSILALADFLRFSIAEENEGLNSLEEEIKYIKIYLDLNNEKEDNKLLIDFNTSGNLELYQIPHLCILTLVENAFKHGDLKKEPLEIKIDASEDSLTIFIKNKKRTAVIDKDTGLNNLERRLGLLLKDKFVLETKEENDFFISLLTIKN